MAEGFGFSTLQPFQPRAADGAQGGQSRGPECERLGLDFLKAELAGPCLELDMELGTDGCESGGGGQWLFGRTRKGLGWLGMENGMENWDGKLGRGYCGRAENFVNLHRNHRYAAFTMRKAKWTRIFVRRSGVTIPLKFSFLQTFPILQIL